MLYNTQQYNYQHFLTFNDMSTIKSFSRGLTILEILAQQHEGVSVTDLSERLDVDKSTVTRLLQTLVQHEFAQKDTNSRRYLLGPKMAELLNKANDYGPLKEKAVPFIEELRDVTGENAHVAIYSRGRCLVIADIESQAQLRVVSGEGRLIPNHCTAIGKCLIAFGVYPLPSDLPMFTPRTITAADQLRMHLEQIRAKGYAIDDEEHELGVRCIAAPIFDSTGKAIASMGISGPTVRVTLPRVSELAATVINHANKFSKAINEAYLAQGTLVNGHQ